jgi:hypothetical protein
MFVSFDAPTNGQSAAAMFKQMLPAILATIVMKSCEQLTARQFGGIMLSTAKSLSASIAFSPSVLDIQVLSKSEVFGSISRRNAAKSCRTFGRQEHSYYILLIEVTRGKSAAHVDARPVPMITLSCLMCSNCATAIIRRIALNVSTVVNPGANIY